MNVYLSDLIIFQWSFSAMLLTLSCWISSLCWFSWLLRRLFSWWRLSMVRLCCAVICVLLSICNLRTSIIFSRSSNFSLSVSLSACRVWHCVWASSNLARCWKNQCSFNEPSKRAGYTHTHTPVYYYVLGFLLHEMDFLVFLLQEFLGFPPFPGPLLQQDL